jgi:single-stranded DNA-binding protein
MSTKYKASDSMKEETLFIDVVVWGNRNQLPSILKRKVCAGRGQASGKALESDGQQKSKFEVVAQSVKFLYGSKRSGGRRAVAERRSRRLKRQQISNHLNKRKLPIIRKEEQWHINKKDFREGSSADSVQKRRNLSTIRISGFSEII